nr:HSPB1-associated protein 1 isoform X1 [Onthophagus taurus]
MSVKRKYNDCSGVQEDFRYLIENYNQPIVFKNVLNWHILSWRLQDWKNVLKNEIVKYRVGKWTYTENPQWDNKTEIRSSTFNEFLEIDDTENWGYCDYKHLVEHFKDVDEIQNCISWKSLGFPEYTAKESTIWFGTKGAHTPCHKDTYGYNLVAQIYGRKRWLLFPPNQNLQPTRIPYEESSIFSKLNFFSPNKSKFNDLNNCKMIILEPGDVLFVPHNWWHYVENLEFAISVNTWLKSPVYDDEKQFDEAIVQFIIGRFYKEIGELQKKILINPSTDMKLLEEQMGLNNSLQILDVCRRKIALKSKKKVEKINENIDCNHILEKYSEEIVLLKDLDVKDFDEFLTSQSARFVSSTTVGEEENSDGNDDFLFKPLLPPPPAIICICLRMKNDDLSFFQKIQTICCK